MQLAILTLNDGRIGILIDRTILQGEEMTLMSTIVADGKAQWGTRSLLGIGQGLKIIVDEHMPSIFQGHSIRSTLVVLYIQECHLAPSITTIATKAGSYLRIVSAHQHLESAILQFEDGGLYTVDVFSLFTFLIYRVAHIGGGSLHIVGAS